METDVGNCRRQLMYFYHINSAFLFQTLNKYLRAEWTARLSIKPSKQGGINVVIDIFSAWFECFLEGFNVWDDNLDIMMSNILHLGFFYYQGLNLCAWKNNKNAEVLCRVFVEWVQSYLQSSQKLI